MPLWALDLSLGFMLKWGGVGNLESIIALLGFLAFLWFTGEIGGPVLAQVMGDEAEMDRLAQRAEEAMAYDDPHGAALSIGKAALMAALLAQEQQEQGEQKYYATLTKLFRAQEEAYRAVALFEQTGRPSPPPSGVCQALLQSQTNIQDSQRTIRTLGGEASSPVQERLNRYLSLTEDWMEILPNLYSEFSC